MNNISNKREKVPFFSNVLFFNFENKSSLSEPVFFFSTISQIL